MAKAKVPLKVHYLYDGEVEITIDGRHHYEVRDKGVRVDDVINTTAVSGLVDKSAAMKGWAVNLTCDLILSYIRNGEEITEEFIDLVARKHHYQKLKEASDMGTAVHDWAEAYINSCLLGGEQPELPADDADDRLLNGVLAFLRWKDEHNIEFVSSERIVYSRKYRTVGKMDAEVRITGKLTVGDFKTSNAKKVKKGKEEEPCSLCARVGCGGVYSDFRYQTAGYQMMCIEEYQYVNKTTENPYTGDRIVARFDKDTGEFEVHTLDNYEADRDAFLGLLIAKRREMALE